MAMDVASGNQLRDELQQQIGLDKELIVSEAKAHEQAMPTGMGRLSNVGRKSLGHPKMAGAGPFGVKK
jgi:hypothetical protein